MYSVASVDIECHHRAVGVAIAVVVAGRRRTHRRGAGHVRMNGLRQRLSHRLAMTLSSQPFGLCRMREVRELHETCRRLGRMAISEQHAEVSLCDDRLGAGD